MPLGLRSEQHAIRLSAWSLRCCRIGQRRPRTRKPGGTTRRIGPRERRVMSRERWMALFFALGSTCFLIGPFPGYVQLVGESADAITFFIGSILFTAGGGLQSWLAWSERHSPGGGRAAWWAAVVQSAGTLFFNLTTYQAMDTALTSPEYDRLVWRPDWRGSICSSSRARSPTAPRRVMAGCRRAAARDGGSRRSTCSAASSSESRLSPAMSFRRPGRCSTRRRPTGTPRWAPHASWPVRSTPCTPTGSRRCRWVGGSVISSTGSRPTSGK